MTFSGWRLQESLHRHRVLRPRRLLRPERGLAGSLQVAQEGGGVHERGRRASGTKTRPRLQSRTGIHASECLLMHIDSAETSVLLMKVFDLTASKMIYGILPDYQNQHSQILLGRCGDDGQVAAQDWRRRPRPRRWRPASSSRWNQASSARRLRCSALLCESGMKLHRVFLELDI